MYYTYNIVKKNKNNRMWWRVQERPVKNCNYINVKISRSWKALELEHIHNIANYSSLTIWHVGRHTIQVVRILII